MSKALLIILLLIIAALVAALVVFIVKRPKVVELSDSLPASKKRKDCWLKLQNEGKQYLKIKDGRVYLKVVK